MSCSRGLFESINEFEDLLFFFAQILEKIFGRDLKCTVPHVEFRSIYTVLKKYIGLTKTEFEKLLVDSC